MFFLSTPSPAYWERKCHEARAEVENLKEQVGILNREIKYLDQKITSATRCHPNAVPILLNEGLERTHFKKREGDSE